jgi:hypothetical protein
MRLDMFHTFTLDIFDENLKVDSRYKRFANVMTDAFEGKVRLPEELRELRRDPIFSEMYDALGSRTNYYVATRKYMVAVVPQTSRIGDRISLFHGVSTPFVIRSFGFGRYRLVGSCYLHGVMMGEAMERSGDDDYFTIY